jgi:putative heme-binding domain-containing protein
VKACFDANDPELARAVMERWPACSRTVRRKIIALCGTNAKAALALLDAVSAGKIPLVEVDANTRQALQKQSDWEVQERAKKLFAASASADREQVITTYRPALTMTADRARGAAVFEKNCTVCHQMQGVGAKVGPDLSGVGQQPRETLLAQILDPSSAVLPDFVAYTATTKSGDTYTGFVANESANTVTLRRANEPDITLRRADLKEFTTNGKSIMPDGLEAAITIQDMADLLEFLRRPDRTLFTQAK